MPFFVEDFRWTSQNYASMASRVPELRRWWSLAEPLRAVLSTAERGEGGAPTAVTLEEFAERIDAEEKTSGKDRAGTHTSKRRFESRKRRSLN